MSFVFFFKQKTAYEMRISDWSSDVCSSDLDHRHPHGNLTGRGKTALAQIIGLRHAERPARTVLHAEFDLVHRGAVAQVGWHQSLSPAAKRLLQHVGHVRALEGLERLAPLDKIGRANV